MTALPMRSMQDTLESRRIRRCMDEVREVVGLDQHYRDEDPVGSLIEAYRNAACVIQLHRLERGQHSPAREDGNAAPSEQPSLPAPDGRTPPTGGDLHHGDGTCWDGVDPDAGKAVDRIVTALLLLVGSGVLLFWLRLFGVL